MKIEILTGNKDILALALLAEGPVFETVQTWGLPELAPLLEASSRLLQLESMMPYLRVVVGCNTIVVQREYGHIIAACFPTGHDVAKSVHRMIRRAAKPARGKKEVDGAAQ